MEIAVFSPDKDGSERLTMLITSNDRSARISVLPMDEPVLRPLPNRFDAAFVLADELGALLTLEKIRVRAPKLPIILVSRRPDFALEGIRQQVSDYLIWPLDAGDVRKSLKKIENGKRSMVAAYGLNNKQ